MLKCQTRKTGGVNVFGWKYFETKHELQLTDEKQLQNFLSSTGSRRVLEQLIFQSFPKNGFLFFSTCELWATGNKSPFILFSSQPDLKVHQK